ncbi:MAG: methyltransferase domain-containing protein [Gemmatimonadetes bacterium]|nr:methyltransferase domain-containing protein [Gemmatimonadota bacterium]
MKSPRRSKAKPGKRQIGPPSTQRSDSSRSGSKKKANGPSARRPTDPRPGKPGKSSGRTKRDRPPEDKPSLWVGAALPGLEDLLKSELDGRFRDNVTHVPHTRRGECHFLYGGRSRALLSLRLCHVLSLRRDFRVARPRTLLSPEHLAAIVQDLKKVMVMTPSDRFSGLRLDAAGSDSPTMQRLGTQVAEKLSMSFENETGDLVLALRPGEDGWEVLSRVGNRPLGTRTWRKVDYRGSLSGTVAAALVELSSPAPGDRFLNLMCGSGSILIERLKWGRAGGIVGVDNIAAALDAAKQNSTAAGMRDQIQLMQADTRNLPFAEGSFDRLCVDLPWGQSIGSRETNISLYRDTFIEAHRICRRRGKFVVLTQDHRSLDALEGVVERGWRLLGERSFTQRGFRPRCRVYERTDS